MDLTQATTLDTKNPLLQGTDPCLKNRSQSQQGWLFLV